MTYFAMTVRRRLWNLQTLRGSSVEVMNVWKIHDKKG